MPANIYEQLGVRTLINANATLTRLGGSIMPKQVVDAMAEASKHYINLDELQIKVSERLAQITHNEAAYVATGAAAGLTLATAACITGTDPAAIAQLPDLTGLKNEVIVHKSHRNGYDHAVRQVGVKLVEIGSAVATHAWELEKAINERTAAIFWFQGWMTGRADLPLQTVIDIAKSRGVPVVVDAAAQLPPRENLWKFTQMGAALAVFSGGKDMSGPQSTGLVVGRSDLIQAIRLNGPPNHSIGRPMKVSKEGMIGLLKAVELYMEIDEEARLSQDEETVAGWCAELNKFAGVRAERSFPNEAGQPLPRAIIHIDVKKTSKTRDQIVADLLNGNPAISVSSEGNDVLYLNPWSLTDEEEVIVLERLKAVLRA